MKVLADQLVLGSQLANTNSPVPGSSPHAAARRTAAPAREESGQSVVNVAPMGGHQSDVSFRRDPNGRLYYVVTDAQSGKEIQQLPPQAVRNVGQEIDEYLKREEAKATRHVNVKA